MKRETINNLLIIAEACLLFCLPLMLMQLIETIVTILKL